MSLPPVPPKRRVIEVGGSKLVTDKHSLTVDMEAFGLNDIHHMIIGLVDQDVGVEVRAGNEPTQVIIDNSYGKQLANVERKAEVLFAESLDVSALNDLLGVLIANIKKSTNTRTGQLSSPTNWRFYLVRNGVAQRMPESGKVILKQRDNIILMPRLYYASSANMRVAGTANSFDYKPDNAKPGSKVAKRNQGLGFMAMTARQARGMAAFINYAVTVGNTKRFAVPGERRRYGTVFLMIKPRRKGYRR